MAGEAAKIRLDKWLWQARLFKTRSLAARVVTAGIRVNSQRIAKPACLVGPGDVLTFAKEKEVRVIRIEAVGARRGPATEAQALYCDLAPPEPRAAKEPQMGTVPRFDGKGRPTKRDRRLMEQTRGQALE